MALIHDLAQELFDDLNCLEVYQKRRVNMGKFGVGMRAKNDAQTKKEESDEEDLGQDSDARQYKWITTGCRSKPVYEGIEVSSCTGKILFEIKNNDYVQILGDYDEKEFYIAKVLELYPSQDLINKHAKIQWFYTTSEIPKTKLKDYPSNEFEVFWDSKQKIHVIDAETIVKKCNIKFITDSKKFKRSQNDYFFKCSFNGRNINVLKEDPMTASIIENVPVKESKTPGKPTTTNKQKKEIHKNSTNTNIQETKIILKNITKTPKKNEQLIEKQTITSPLNASSYGRFDASFVALEMLEDDDNEENTEIKILTKSKQKPRRRALKTTTDSRPIEEEHVLNKNNIQPIPTPKIKISNRSTVRRSSRKVPKLVIPKDKIRNKLPKPEFNESSDDYSPNESSCKSSDDYSPNESGSEDFNYLEEKKLTTAIKIKRNLRKSTGTGRNFKIPNINTKFKTPMKNCVTPIVIKMSGNATPYIRPRPTPIRSAKNQLDKARKLLHVSATPDSLPCREEEFQEIFGFVQGMIESGGGGCMYVSGVPGTGKTATVNEVLDNLQAAASDGEISKFLFAKINGMSLTEPRQAYVQLLQQITGEKVPTNMAAEKLAQLFSKRRKQSIVLLADELDLLWTKKQDVMYHLFDWPTNRHARFIVVAVANTMDLPERMLMNRVASRLGLTRLTFKPYTFKQLQEIVASRLQGLDVFEPDAIQLVSRKIAAVSGDARRCLDICRRATEIAEQSDLKRVGIEHVHNALQEMFATPMIKAIRSASLHEQMFLRAVVAEYRRLGVEEATLGQITVQHRVISQLDGLAPISNSTILMMASNLSTCRLILMEGGRRDLYARIRLNLSVDDVLFALNC